ncbi:MAG: hypothetical protein LBR70_07330 [Lactobacillaceae bacterium]|jgi:hypothetical protein|nr:hypothetical protein [Lactobacillaceae bacterium]
MYIWVVLATFIVALYSFNLSHRADMKEMLTLPQAEAVIGKMITQQRGAKKYVEGHSPQYNGQDVVSYFPGELTPEVDLKNYLPYGFINNREQGDYRTLIYCLDKNDATRATQLPGCGNNMVSCCSDPNSANYIVTFGCIPRKWRNVRTGKPRPEFYKALHRIAVDGTETGYAEYLDEEEFSDSRNVHNSKMAIRARNINLISIPQFIVEGKLAGVEYSFSDICGDNRKDEDGQMLSYGCDKCLVYISPVY